MKNGITKIFIFDIFIFVVLLINAFLVNFLSGYYMSLFLLITILIFNLLFVLEKARYRYLKDIMFELTIDLFIFFIIFYLSGLFIGFYRINNYFSLDKINIFILPLFLMIVFKEYLRFQMFNKFQNNKFLYVLTLVVFIFIDCTNQIYFGDFNTFHSIFLIISITVLPSISNNIFLSYLASNCGFIPGIYYLLVMNLYQYFIPIIPNPSKYLLSIINLLFPIILFIRFRNIILKEKDLDVLSRGSKYRYVGGVVVLIFTLVLFYFNSGYFPHMSIAVASNSMYPNIKKGDLVIIKKIDDEEEIIKDNIIAYKYGDVVIIHRVNRRKVIDNKYYYYTKGDANRDIDDWIVERKMIIGKVIFKIPYLGVPTIWIRDL